jgi:hypothetical protein
MKGEFLIYQNGRMITAVLNPSIDLLQKIKSRGYLIVPKAPDDTGVKNDKRKENDIAGNAAVQTDMPAAGSL